MNRREWTHRLGSRLPRSLRTPRGRRRLGGLLLLCFPLILALCCQLITLRSLPGTLSWLWGHPGPLLLTAGLLLLALLFLLMAFGRPGPAALVTALPPVVLAVVSTVKELVNGAPLLLSDLSMASEAGAIAGFVRPGMSWGRGTLPALLLLGLFLGALALLFHGASLAPGRYRIIGCELVAALLVLVLCVSPLKGLALGEEGEDQAGRNNRLGFLLGLYSAGVQRSMLPPGDYSQEQVDKLWRQLEREAEPSPQGQVKPNVVLLVSESFFDITALPHLSFARDPLVNYHALQSRWPTGAFLSNTYAGGTGNVEMELLTGIPSGFLGAGESPTTLSDPTVYSRLPSLARAFSLQGYETVMVHSFDDSLYHRSETLPQLGFDTLVYQEDFPAGSHQAGGYLSDHSLTQELIRRFEAKGEGPIFLYGLSMENHAPYYGDKFRGEPSLLGTDSDLLDEEELATVDCLAHGLRDADRALGELLDYFSSQPEPVLVVFLGDHMPGLYVTEEDSLYVKLGYSSDSDTQRWGPAEMKKMHSTAFLVWNNYDAHLPIPKTLSCTSLGARLLSWAEAERPLYFQWVDRSSRDMLLYRTRLFVDGNGRAWEKPPVAAEGTVSKWRSLVYDLLRR